MPNQPKRVLAIGLDAAESSLVEKWMAEGVLPNLASLRARGTFGTMSSTADWLAGSPWPTFYSGTLPGEHGIYHYLQWRAENTEYERPGPGWIKASPFWRRLGDQRRVIAVDMPLTFPPGPFNGVEISGWASHDRIFPTSSYPGEKIGEVIREFGQPPIQDEVGGLQDIEDLLKSREELILAVRKESQLVSDLLESEEWDLCLCCFSSTHRAGHKFWDSTNTKGECTEEKMQEYHDALRSVYRSCDEAIGRILGSIRDEAVVLIYSLHGMGPNTSLSEFVLPKMLSNILGGGKESVKKDNLIKRLRRKIPLEWRSNLRKLFPLWLQHKMTAYWRMGGTDWSQTRAFNLIADLQGYVRINLKGREGNGIVEEGEDYDKLCRQIIEGIRTFKDEQTSEPVADSIRRSDQVYEKGEGSDRLPDLLVQWGEKPAAGYLKIVSSEFGGIEWPAPGKNPDGRSGNHRPDGFLIAVGGDFQENATFERKPHIVDLAPTILNLLGIEKPEKMKGNSLLKSP